VKRQLSLGLSLATLLAGSAFGQATRTWVSGVGDDANPCSRTAPCKTYAGAISKTAAGGEISTLDPGGFGTVTITKSMIINGRGTLAGILASGTNGVTINNSTGSPMTVVLRDIDIVSGVNGVRVFGSSPTTVVLENVRISGQSNNGVEIVPSAGGAANVSIRSSSIIGATGSGINADASAAAVNLVVDSSTVTGSGTGVSVSGARALVRMSDLSQNTTGATVTGSGAAVTLDSSIVTQTTTAVSVLSAGASARLANSTIMDNTTGLATVSGGALISFNNNRIKNNTTNGAPTSVQLQN